METRIILLTGKGTVLKLEVSKNWDGTFGPFTYGTPIIFNVTKEGDYYALTKFTGKISVSKNNEPFVFKAEEHSSNQPLSMTYTIDF